MSRSWRGLLLAHAVIAWIATGTLAYGQGSPTSSLAGVVVDIDGKVVPGAKIAVKSEDTGGESLAISSSTGGFTVPALNPGSYTVTVSLAGFKTAVLKGVTVTSGLPANVHARLEVGAVTETLEVQAGGEPIQTHSAAVSTTLNTRSITSLPVATRSALDFAQFLAGVQTATTVRSSTIDGLPQSGINITLDGVNIQDNTVKTSDGFFAVVSPRLDATEEMTVTSAAQGAESNGQGALQIQFTTRSGSNTFSGSSYYFYQSDRLNSNTFANEARDLPKGPLTLNQPGFRASGPVVLPRFDGRNRLFFFANYEEMRQPSTITTASTLLLPDAQNGIFRYANGPAAGVNLYSLAAANGQIATPDPVILKLLQDIRASAIGPGTLSPITGSLNTERYSFQQSAPSIARYPTIRADYNLSSRYRISFAWNHNIFPMSVDTNNRLQRTWPGFPLVGDQGSTRDSASAALRSTHGQSLVNELRVAYSGAPAKFQSNVTVGMFNGPLANQAGFDLRINDALALTRAGSTSNPTERNATTRLLGDTVNWARGTHDLSFGGEYARYEISLLTQSRVPVVDLGVTSTADPALAIFSAGNFPGSTSADRSNAAALYGVLTGRVTQISATARIDPKTGKYVYLGDSLQQGRLQQADFFVQDNWRARPNLSINLGVRYSLQLPFYPLNASYSTATPDDVWGISGFRDGCDLSAATPATCNLFRPGTLTNVKPTYKNFAAGVQAYKTDWNNFAPSLGVNWSPSATHGVLRRLLGDQGRSSLSAGFTRSYERHGLSDFTDQLSSNPGVSIDATRSTGNGNLTLPLLLRSGYLGPPDRCPPLPAAKPTGCLLDAPEYPLSNPTATGSINIFDPNLQVPFNDTWTIGFQRALGARSALEVRYVGTRSRQQWSGYNYNEPDILENGFLDEFRLAQANLQANITSGNPLRAASFAYFGPGTGTSPLPIYLAFFSGVPRAQADDPAKYTSANFASPNFVNPLARFNPNPFTPAGTSSTTGLAGDPTRQANSIAAGLPANFFRVNPDMLGGANAVGNGSFTRYDSLQAQFRRRLSGGLQLGASYVVGEGFASTRYSFRVPRILTRTTGAGGDVTHALKSTFVYELPFGQGRRFGSGSGPAVDRLINGWQLNGTLRLQSGRLFDLGNITLHGMSEKDVQQMFKLRVLPKENSNIIIYAWPQDVIDNTILAFATSATSATGYGAGGPPSGQYFGPANSPSCLETISNTYGTCGVRSLIVTGPIVKNLDLSLRKLTRLAGRTTFEFSLDVFNVFNWVTFVPATGLASGLASPVLAGYQATLPASARTMQLGTRFSW